MASAETSPVRVAIVGAGFISDYHVNGLRAAGGADVCALVGRRPETLAVRARALGIARTETDHRAVLDDPTVNAVVIATPDDTHAAIAIDALAAGKAVLLQKPMALTSAECRAILAADTKRHLSVSFMHRHFPEVRWLRERVRCGELGSIHAVRIRNATPGADWSDWFYAPGQVAGGVVMQLGVHGIDLARHLFGPIREVSAIVSTAQPERRLKDGRVVHTTLEDNAAALYRFDGPVGSHEMSYTEKAGTDRFRLEVHGDAGTVWLRTERGAAAVHAPALTGVDGWVAPPFADEPLGADHHARWLAAVRGEEPPDDTAEAGLASILVAEAIYRAADERRAVAVTDPAGLSDNG
ncbi:MAG TPA: Gfo/Idh/MocA family oxidoreductase [Methylomirabilota bacterium]|nr:Gfo/Idh/MocA family oxidoreductase [Methylomirabilota bacterium]